MIASLVYSMKRLSVLALILVCFVSLQSIAQSHADGKEINVTYFLSSTCKICQFYSIELNGLYQDYASKGIHFRGLFPGKLETDSTVTEFGKVYSLPFPLKIDKYEEHRSLNATITPEVFVTNKSGEILYHGRIDDAYFSVGKRRARVKNHELRNVLDVLLKGEVVPALHVPAVGCIIEK